MLTVNVYQNQGLILKNRKELILRDPDMGFGYFKLREFKVVSRNPYNQEDVIEAFIKSIYFLWKNKPDKFKYKEEGREVEVNWNLHGIYDADKIEYSDFVIKSFNEFKENLFDLFRDKTKNIEIIETEKLPLDIKEIVRNPMQLGRKLKENLLGTSISKDVINNEVSKFANSMGKAIDEYNDDKNTFYVLVVNDKNKLHKHTVFAYFFSAIMINVNTNTFVTFEFGLD